MENKPSTITCSNCGHPNFLVVMKLDTIKEIKFDFTDEIDEDETREKFGVNLI